MTPVAHAELLVGKALAYNGCSRTAKEVRQALLISALRELQAEAENQFSPAPPPSE
jgi:hypothetical protein